ncbi:MAG TPA: UbiD family decarboxylase [Chthoniobacterales bacterium]|jgi:4-hydroxy-3-polyprenylbenzoate decarboxylase|nr:UbiD family decarboxylase [Chthoniobacterales bacterium]
MKQECKNSPGALDLRDWLRCVQDIGELTELEGVHWDKEMGSLTQLVHEQILDAPPALLFSRIPGYPDNFRTLYGMLSSPKRLAMTLGISDPGNHRLDLLRAFRKKLNSVQLIPPQAVTHGPVLENIVRGEKVDVLKFPVPKHHENDPARFIGTGCAVILKHPDQELYNVGTYRSMVYNEREIGLEMNPGNDGGKIQRLYLERNQPMPVVICVGQHPLFYFVGATPQPRPEFEVAGGLIGAPVDVIRGPTTGLPIPACAEIALEGFVHPQKIKPEGPFGEWMGYYASEIVDRPYVTVETILHRDDPILTCSAQHTPPDETYLLHALGNSAKVWTDLEALGVRGIQGVWQIEGGSGKKFLVLSIEQAFEGHARQVLHAAAASRGALFGGKWIVVVDTDIDPTNVIEVMWALSSRVNALDDMDFVRVAPTGSIIDPLTGQYHNTRILVDATVPYARKIAGTFPKAVKVSDDLKRSLMNRWGDLFNRPSSTKG